jgi:hypothetical protein
MKTPHSKFERYDAWVLAAVVYANGGREPVSLRGVIQVADGLNHAILSRDELELAFARLDRAAYVRVVPGGFQPTPAALAIRKPVPFTEVIDLFARAIGAPKWSSQGELPQASTENYVSKIAYEQACEYLGKS